MCCYLCLIEKGRFAPRNFLAPQNLIYGLLSEIVINSQVALSPLYQCSIWVMKPLRNINFSSFVWPHPDPLKEEVDPSLLPTEGKVSMKGWWSKIFMPCERGPYSDIKKQNIFSICRGKFLTIFKENLDRVPPCPSTWHEDTKRERKFTKKDPYSAPLEESIFWLILPKIEVWLNCYHAHSYQ